MKGTAGSNGKSAYEIAVDNGFEGTETEWLASLAGKTGAYGKDGKSAYELAKDNGFTGSLSEWLDSLIGQDGKTELMVKTVRTVCRHMNLLFKMDMKVH